MGKFSEAGRGCGATQSTKCASWAAPRENAEKRAVVVPASRNSRRCGSAQRHTPAVKSLKKQYIPGVFLNATAQRVLVTVAKCEVRAYGTKAQRVMVTVAMRETCAS
ncbi:hypothetical protein NDU88_000029 [Pleurodeles waltl]|uniref:Uncharacterized protein n=1 Tax=Pleurodeles waltl TaxID=8319 RepID=A0AAV7VTF0_PLEWA|nr:hypothetical protein NDU88_000029 [Pleurodeles waltl]